MRVCFALSTCLCGSLLVACDQPPTNVLVTLAPEVVSSIDGRTTVRAVVLSDAEPLAEQPVTLTIAYADRHGTAHEVAPLSGTTDERGAFAAPLTGLIWEGSGAVTVAVTGEPDAGGEARFAVIDRTPPTVAITPPTTSRHVVQGQDITVPVAVQDEIGVSEVFLEAGGELERLRSTVVASGAADATVDFELTIPDNARVGGTITLYALAGDLSGNLSAATPVELIVDARP